MKRPIKYLGIAAILLGLLLFVLHVVISYRGNALLFTSSWAVPLRSSRVRKVRSEVCR